MNYENFYKLSNEITTVNSMMYVAPYERLVDLWVKMRVTILITAVYLLLFNQVKMFWNYSRHK